MSKISHEPALEKQLTQFQQLNDTEQMQVLKKMSHDWTKRESLGANIIKENEQQKSEKDLNGRKQNSLWDQPEQWAATHPYALMARDIKKYNFIQDISVVGVPYLMFHMLDDFLSVSSVRPRFKNVFLSRLSFLNSRQPVFLKSLLAKYRSWVWVSQHPDFVSYSEKHFSKVSSIVDLNTKSSKESYSETFVLNFCALILRSGYGLYDSKASSEEKYCAIPIDQMLPFAIQLAKKMTDSKVLTNQWPAMIALTVLHLKKDYPNSVTDEHFRWALGVQDVGRLYGYLAPQYHIDTPLNFLLLHTLYDFETGISPYSITIEKNKIDMLEKILREYVLVRVAQIKSGAVDGQIVLKQIKQNPQLSLLFSPQVFVKMKTVDDIVEKINSSQSREQGKEWMAHFKKMLFSVELDFNQEIRLLSHPESVNLKEFKKDKRKM